MLNCEIHRSKQTELPVEFDEKYGCLSDAYKQGSKNTGVNFFFFNIPNFYLSSSSEFYILG